MCFLAGDGREMEGGRWSLEVMKGDLDLWGGYSEEVENEAAGQVGLARVGVRSVQGVPPSS